MRRIDLLSALRQDVVLALRTLVRAKLPVLMAATCLAVGIAATTTMFTVGHALLLSPLPYPNGERLTYISSARENETQTYVSSLPDVTDWRARQRQFADIGAWHSASVAFVTTSDAVKPRAVAVTGGFFATLGVKPEAGRLLTDADARTDGPRVLVVASGFARRTWGDAARAAGAVVRINREPYTVVGVVPDQWRFPDRTELWLPITDDPARVSRGDRNLQVIGALRPGKSVDDGQREMSVIASALARENPDDATFTVRIAPLRETYVGGAKAAFVVLAAAGFLLFAIACANVATLQLARATARVREIAVRTALGASRRRLVFQLLVENGALAIMSGIAGLWLSVSAAGLIGRTMVDRAPEWMSFGLDARVLIFTLGVSGAAGIGFGLFPALRLTRGDMSRVLRAGGRGGLDLTRGRLYRGLVGAEIALSLVLVVGSIFALQSFQRLARIDTGYDPSNVIIFSVSATGPRYDSSATSRVELVGAVAERLKSIPGVTAVGATTRLPLLGCCSKFGFQIEGRPSPTTGAMPMAAGTQVTPAYFSAMRIPIVKGRDFSAADDEHASRVTVISETFARTYWPGHDPLGKRLHLQSSWWTVVGVVKDIRQNRLLDVPEPQFYRPYAQDPWDEVSFAIRTSLDPAAVAGPARAALRSIDGTLPAFDLTTMDEKMTGARAAQRVYAILLTGVALTALLLAAAGVYGVTAYYVSRRTHEIGIRMALGADASDVFWLLLRQTGTIVIVGSLVGGVASIAAGRFLAHVMYGIRPGQATVYVVGTLLLAFTALVAILGPANRAIGIQPNRALQSE